MTSTRALPFLLAVGLLAAGFAAPAFAAPTIKATRLSTDQVKLGVPFSAEVVISGGGGNAGWRAEPLAPDGAFALLGQSVLDEPTDAVVKLDLGLYALGPHTLPGITLVSRAGVKLLVPGEASITGTPSLAKGDEQLHALAGPQVPLVLDRVRVALAAVAALLALCLLALGGRAIVRLFRASKSPEKRDRRALEALLRSGCSDLEFYLALDGIVRRHLERKHGIPALERTATELSLLVNRAPALPSAELGRLFGAASLVKFAERGVEPAQRDADGHLAIRLLHEPKSQNRGSHVAAPLP